MTVIETVFTSDQSDENDQYKILEFTTPHECVSVYILKPGQTFERFGGSRGGLVVKGNASLIIRAVGRYGSSDVEHDVHNINRWRQLFDGMRNAIEEASES